MQAGKVQIALDIWKAEAIKKKPTHKGAIEEAADILQWQAIQSLAEDCLTPQIAANITRREYKAIAVVNHFNLPPNLRYLIEGAKVISEVADNYRFNLWCAHMTEESDQCLCCYLETTDRYLIFGGWRADTDPDELELFATKGNCDQGAIEPVDSWLITDNWY